MKSHFPKTMVTPGRLLSLLVIAIFSSPLLAVDCSPPYWVSLSSQVDVNNFQANYGGGGTCDTLVSGLSISGSDITSLAPLSALTSVGGSLEIGFTSLINVDGLSNLTSVGEELNLQHNIALTNVDGLANLTSIGGELSVFHNDKLTNVDGLTNLTSVGINLQLIGNKVLTNLNGLSALVSVGRDVYLTEHPSLADCTGLTTLLDSIDDGAAGPGPGIAGIPDVGGDVTMVRNLPGCNRGRYVALGDSYSSGEGAGTYYIDLDGDGKYDPGEDTGDPEANMCHRSAFAYPWKSRFIMDVKPIGFFACSGAETINIQISGEKQTRFSPDNVTQLNREPINDNTDLVSITIGGNDARFADILKWCYDKPNCASYDPWGSTGELQNYVPQLIASSVKPSVQATIADIKTQVAPTAKIYLMGYPKLFPPEGSNCESLTERFGNNSWAVDEQIWINELSVKLNKALEEVACTMGIGFIPVTSQFSDHEICQPAGSWFNEPAYWNLLSQEIFHPTAHGYVFGYRTALENRLKVDQTVDSQSCLASTAPAKIQADGAEPQAAVLPTIGSLDVTPVSAACDTGIYPPGQALEVSGTKYAPATQVTLYLSSFDGVQQIGTAEASAEGTFFIGTNLPASISESYLALLEARGTGANAQPRVSTGSFAIGPEAGSDTDSDGIPDICDICPAAYNPGQEDADTDGLGDACDACPLDASNDSDYDGHCANLDTCPFDSTNDADADALCAEIDNCPAIFNPNQSDSDDDLVGDECDNCAGSADAECFFSNGFEVGNKQP